MSTTPPPPPDRPTQRLQPQPPPVDYEQRVVERGVAAPATDWSVVFARLQDSISSLRTGLVLIGILSALALGLALYALLGDDNGGGRRGASSERVSRLDDRVDRLSRQVQGLRAGDSATSALADRVDRLSRSVTALRSQAAKGAAAAPDSTQAIDQLGQRVDDLSRQLQDLRQKSTTPP